MPPRHAHADRPSENPFRRPVSFIACIFRCRIKVRSAATPSKPRFQTACSALSLEEAAALNDNPASLLLNKSIPAAVRQTASRQA
ncbi:hypothetical protein [Kingella potus]|uniref:hypothetical protein n=1 Tax=Kingella potus TaxID=265175 RepID=UPI001FD580EA|nr:hypothetical protein [Kingella potus]UOP01755.1 hypothetical protein LVJ84_06485 [Kingella potus]